MSNRKKGGRPSIKLVGYWLNQLPQFDPKRYQTEEQYHNVFAESFPKTWGRVRQNIKLLVTDYFNSYGPNGNETTKKEFDAKYRTPPANAVPHVQNQAASSNAIADAMKDVAIARNQQPMANSTGQFATDAIEAEPESESERRRMELQADLGGGLLKQKMQKQSNQQKEFQSQVKHNSLDTAEGAQDYREQGLNEAAKKTSEAQEFAKNRRAYEFMWTRIEYYKLKKKYNQRGPEYAAKYDKIVQNSKDVFDEFVGKPHAYEEYEGLDKVYGNPNRSLWQNNREKQMYEFYLEKQLDDRSKYSDTVWATAGFPLNWNEWIDKLDNKMGLSTVWNIDDMQKQKEYLEHITSAGGDSALQLPGSTTGSMEERAKPYTLDSEGKIQDDDPDKAYFNKKAKTAITIQGHEFDDPINTIRPDYGLAGAADVVPEPKKQTISDVMFDMFGVVPPGFGNGATNKLFLQQQSWEKFVKYGGKMFGPNTFDGPTCGVKPMPPQWTRLKSDAFIEQNRKSFNSLHDMAINTAQRHSVTEQPAGALPIDYGLNSTLSSKKLPRSRASVLMPVISNRAAFQPAFDPPAFQRTEKRRKLFDPVRHPNMSASSYQNNGIRMPLSLARREILQ